MPEEDEVRSQPPIELLRQLIDHQVGTTLGHNVHAGIGKLVCRKMTYSFNGLLVPWTVDSFGQVDANFNRHLYILKMFNFCLWNPQFFPVGDIICRQEKNI